MWTFLAVAAAAECTVTGTVKAVASGAVAGHPVLLARDVDYSLVEVREARTDATGRFTATIGEGRWHVSAVRADAVPGTHARLACDDGEAFEVPLTLATGQVTVRGRLVDSAGRPLDGRVTLVQAGGHDALAGLAVLPLDHGEFATMVRGERQYVVYGSAPGHHFASKTLMFDQDKGARSADVRLTLRELARVSGRLEGDRGLPVEGARIHVGPAGRVAAATNVFTGADGAFTVEVSDGVAHGLGATHADGVACVRDRRPLDEGQRAGPVVLRLEPGRAVAGRVTDARGDPVVGAEVMWSYPDCWLYGTTGTLADGEFAFAHVVDATVEVFVPGRSNRITVGRLQGRVDLRLQPERQ